MKLKFDEKLFKYAKYVVLTSIILYICFLCISNIGEILGATFGAVSYGLSLLKPLITACIIAYLFYPLAKFIEGKCNKLAFKKSKNKEHEEIIKKDLSSKEVKKLKTKKSKRKTFIRIISIIVAYMFILGVVIAILFGIYFMIGGQLTKSLSLSTIFNSISEYIVNFASSELSFSDNIKNLDIPFLETFKPQIESAIETFQNYLAENLGNMTSSIFTIGSNIANFFVALVISIYILKDREYFMNLWKGIYRLIFGKSKLGKGISNITYVFHDNFSQFIRGQLLEALAVAIMSSIALTLLNVDYALVIGPIAGIMNMIPYVGPVVGTVLACLIALLSGEPIKIIPIIIVMMIVQFIDGNLLAPKIIGDSVGLHPVFIMVAIIIGGTVYGFVGMLIAVPVTAAFRTLFNQWYERHQDGISPNITIELEDDDKNKVSFDL